MTWERMQEIIAGVLREEFVGYINLDESDAARLGREAAKAIREEAIKGNRLLVEPTLGNVLRSYGIPVKGDKQ